MMTNLALAEFRILTSSTDAEYGNYSGGLINVVTKVGGNAFHGSAFQFLRNTNLDAKSYFAKQRSVFQQNQYGGTIGGPIRRNKLFFFADYQGQHTKQGQDTGVVAVPSLANRAGNFSDSPAFNGTVNGPFLAQTLTNLLGRQVSQGEPFSSVFPGNVIPQTAFSGTAAKMLQYIPSPNIGQNNFESSAEALSGEGAIAEGTREAAVLGASAQAAASPSPARQRRR
jgi:hypothetical protein